MSDSKDLVAQMTATLPQVGALRWIGVRPASGVPMRSVASVEVTETGLVGDRYGARKGASGKRAVTLINAEHLAVIGAFAGEGPVDSVRLRRNLVVSGLNLLSLAGRRFRVGSVVLEHTDACDPCSRMEAELGAGGFNAMRGHGGITARVIQPGVISVGDSVAVLAD
jgi:MOSC domain-containing protein YiiM